MMADRGLRYAGAALGAFILLAGPALAEQSWQGFAPRCQTSELAAQPLPDPCGMQVAVFGLGGPEVLSGAQDLDVQTTGSIKEDARGGMNEGETPRAPM